MEKTETEKIIERIKTLEDAMEATGMTLPPEEQLASLPKDVVAFMKLRIIAAALNGLKAETLHEFPTFDEMECRYFPWFKIYSESESRNKTSKEESLLLWGANAYDGSNAGLVCSFSYDAWAASWTVIAARLAVNSDKIAIYFGRQFIGIWKDYIFCQD